VPDLSAKTAEHLALWLSNPSGTVRDIVQRELVHRLATEPPAPDHDEAVAVVQRLLRYSECPATRVQALCTLDGINALTPEDLSAALADAHWAVRQHGVRLCEPLLASAPALGEAVLELAADPDVRVQYQVALSLGEWDDPRVGPALGRLAVSNIEHEWLRVAVLSSPPRWSSDILAALRAAGDQTAAHAEMIEKLIAFAGAAGEQKDDPR
jgi:hypothetical protein